MHARATILTLYQLQKVGTACVLTVDRLFTQGRHAAVSLYYLLHRRNSLRESQKKC